MTASDVGGTAVLRRLTDRLGQAEVAYEAGVWTVTWTDGPPVAQVRQAAEEAAPEAVGRLECRRVLTQDTVALGAVRLATGPGPEGGGRRQISPEAVEDLWREVVLPSPATDRELGLVYAVIYEIHNNHHRNVAHAHEICDLVADGLARHALRAAVPLTPLETLTNHYASGPARRAWRFRLTPLAPADAFQAVHADPRASPEHIAAALTLLPGLPADFSTAAAELRTRRPSWQHPSRHS